MFSSPFFLLAFYNEVLGIDRFSAALTVVEVFMPLHIIQDGAGCGLVLVTVATGK
jgi:hypothetical protein